MNLGFLKYVTLGFEVFNAVMTIVAMIRIPALLDPEAVWEAVKPVLAEIGQIAKVTINMDLAHTVTVNAVDTVKAALSKSPPSIPSAVPSIPA